jgi:hypothetical protein
MEISDANSETATIVVKKEDEPIIFKKKSIDPLPSPEPTEFSGVVPKLLPDAKSLVAGADRAEPERTNHPRLSDEQGNVHTSVNHATRLLVPIDGNSQPAINYRQPLLDLLIAGNESFHPALTDVKTFDDIVNRLNYINEYAKLKIDDSTIERLAILWHLLMDPNYSAAICMTTREVYNNQVGDLVEVLGNDLSLRWDSRTTTQPGGNIDQLIINLLRRILNSDVERYYDRAINGIDNRNFQTRRCRPCAQNFMAVSMWHVPNRSTPDRRWGTDFITDTMINMDRIAILLRHIKDNINAVNRNTDRISGVNPEGIKPHNFSNSQLTQIGKALNKLDENPADSTDRCFVCYKQPKEEPVQIRTPILHHPLPTRPPPALPPHQQWMPPPPPHPRPSPLLPPNPPPTQSTLLTAVNALRKSTGFLQTTSAINHRSGLRQPQTSRLSFTPLTLPPTPRSSATS